MAQIEVITDAATGIWREELRRGSEDGLRLAGANRWLIEKRTLRGGPSHGVDVVTLDNGELSVDVLPTRGMGLWRARYAGAELGWRSPNRFPVHPSLVDAAANHGTGWLAGFNEWMCRCGLSSIGAPEGGHTLHGRIANIPACFVSGTVDDAGAGRLGVRGVVEETSLFGPKLRLDSTTSLPADEPALEIEDAITNLSAEPGELQLLYHFNFGRPWLDAGARIYAAASDVAPYDDFSHRHIERWQECDGPTPGAIQQCFFLTPLPTATGRGSVLLVNAAGDCAVEIEFQLDELPCLTLWKYFAADQDGYVVGLEPGTCYPLPRSQEAAAGRIRPLAPGQTRTLRCRVRPYADRGEISQAIANVSSIQGGDSPRLHTGHF